VLRLEYGDPAAFVPKLYRVTVNELLGPLLGLFVALAKQVYAVPDMAVRPDDVRPVPVHCRTPADFSTAIEIRSRNPAVKMSKAESAQKGPIPNAQADRQIVGSKGDRPERAVLS
jgi:hypothetical protein